MQGGITLVDERIVTRTRAESCQTVLLAAVHLQTWIDSQREAKRRREWDEEAILPSISPSLSISFVSRHGLTPADPRSCLEHVSHSDISILAAKPGCSICFSTLRQITAASPTDGWFPEKREEQDLPHLHIAHCQLIILIINIRRQRAEEKWWKGLYFSFIHPAVREHVFFLPTLLTLVQSYVSRPTFD